MPSLKRCPDTKPWFFRSPAGLLPCLRVGTGVSHVDDYLPLAVLLLFPDRGVLAVIGDELALFVLGGVDVVAVGVAEIGGSGHFGVDGRPGEGRAFGPRGLLAHGVFGVDTAAVYNFNAIFGEVGEKGVVAVLDDIRSKIGFELAQEVCALGGLLFCGDGSGGGEKEQQKKCYGDSVHRKVSGRSGGGFRGQVLGLRCQISGKPCR